MTNTSSVDFTEGRITVPLLKFVLPLFISAFLQQAYQMTDAIIVGRFIGTNALAAVNASNQMATFLIIFLNGLGTGISITTAQLFGAKKNNDIKNLTFSTIYPLLAFAIVLTVTFIVFSEFFLKTVLNIPGDILVTALTYYRLYMIGFVFLLIYNIFSFNLRAMGNSLAPLYFLALSAIINVVLDIVLIIVFGMGVAGTAIATVTAQFMAAAATLYYAFSRVPELNIIDKNCKFDKKLFSTSMKYGIPNALQQVLLGTSTIFLTRLINSFGYITMAAQAAVDNITKTTTQSAQSIARALSAFAGQNVGAGKFDRVAKGMKIATAAGCGLGLLISVVCFIFPAQIISLFVKGNFDAHETITQGVALLGYASAGYIFIFTNFTFAAVLRAAGDVTFTTVGTVIMVAFRISLAYFLVFAGTGYVSISISLLIMNIVGSAVMYIRLRTGKWKEKAYTRASAVNDAVIAP